MFLLCTTSTLNGIVEDVGASLRKLKPRYQRLVVVYGDCGTGRRLDPVLDEVGALRLRGPTATRCSQGRRSSSG